MHRGGAVLAECADFVIYSTKSEQAKSGLLIKARHPLVDGV
jgi:hypothetical protein